jgi:hypothetical protein|tara:strand:+ start:23 stop:283 length:261 start_codon:yes stop_codon:yes gene_type:complete
MAVIYEWVIETIDEHGDIQDVDHADSFPSDVTPVEPWVSVDVALRREDDDSLWSYAYVENGKLPEFFEHGQRVPKRFHREIEREQG